MTDISRQAVERLAVEYDKRVELLDAIEGPSAALRKERAVNTRNCHEATAKTLRALRDALDLAEGQREWLWDLLDNIDSLDDACKENDAMFRRLCYCTQRRRFDISSSDGFKITFNDHVPSKFRDRG